MRGCLITFEGIEGSGKTTQSFSLQEHLKKRGLNAVILREPGSTPVAEALRMMLKFPEIAIPATLKAFEEHSDSAKTTDYEYMLPLTELLIFLAARHEFYIKQITPRLEKGEVILLDRSIDSSRAYQGGGRFHHDPNKIRLINTLNHEATGGIKPDLTIFFDISVQVMRKRVGLDSIEKVASFEKEEGEFFERVRLEYLTIAAKEPRRFKVIDSNRSREEVFSAAEGLISQLINHRQKRRRA